MNIILYILDALRQDFLGCYGFAKNTSPNIDSLSKDAVVYENAYSTTTWTKASIASIITSQYPRSLKMAHRMDVMPEYEDSLPRVLRKYGFQCYAISANLFFSPNFGFSGFDEFFNLQTDKNLSKKRIEDPAAGIETLKKLGVDKAVLAFSEDINEKVFSVLERDTKNNKFIMVLSTDTHNPFFVRGSKSFFGNSSEDFILSRDVKKQNIEKVKLLYYDMIRYNDYHLGQLISRLRKDGVYEGSLIIIMSDHGELFGERRGILGRPITGHGRVAYEEVIKVPLIIKYPKNKFAGIRYKNPVQLVDIYPTILDVCNIRPGGADIEGYSLEPSKICSDEKRVIFVESHIEPKGMYSAAVRIGNKKLIKVEPKLDSSKHPKKIIRYLLEKLLIPSIKFYDLSSGPDKQMNSSKKKSKEKKYFLERCSDITEKCDRKAKLIEKKKEIIINEEVKKHLRTLGYLDD